MLSEERIVEEMLACARYMREIYEEDEKYFESAVFMTHALLWVLGKNTIPPSDIIKHRLPRNVGQKIH